MIYDPREDSYLILKNVKELAHGIVLDVGTGSGILALCASDRNDVKKVYAVDINPEAIKYCKKRIKSDKITFLRSDLFEVFKKRKNKIMFDTIIFNPPYLPDDKRVKDIALDGGKKGNELILRFLKDAKRFLKDDGRIILLFSSLSGRKAIDGEIKKMGMKAEIIGYEKMFFEELFVYDVRKE